jgi:hypothetical protein
MCLVPRDRLSDAADFSRHLGKRSTRWEPSRKYPFMSVACRAGMAGADDVLLGPRGKSSTPGNPTATGDLAARETSRRRAQQPRTSTNGPHERSPCGPGHGDPQPSQRPTTRSRQPPPRPAANPQPHPAARPQPHPATSPQPHPAARPPATAPTPPTVTSRHAARGVCRTGAQAHNTRPAESDPHPQAPDTRPAESDPHPQAPDTRSTESGPHSKRVSSTDPTRTLSRC